MSGVAVTVSAHTGHSGRALPPATKRAAHFAQGASWAYDWSLGEDAAFVNACVATGTEYMPMIVRPAPAAQQHFKNLPGPGRRVRPGGAHASAAARQWSIEHLLNTTENRILDVYQTNQTFPNTTRFLLGFNEPNKPCAPSARPRWPPATRQRACLLPGRAAQTRALAESQAARTAGASRRCRQSWPPTPGRSWRRRARPLPALNAHVRGASGPALCVRLTAVGTRAGGQALWAKTRRAVACHLRPLRLHPWGALHVVSAPQHVPQAISRRGDGTSGLDHPVPHGGMTRGAPQVG